MQRFFPALLTFFGFIALLTVANPFQPDAGAAAPILFSMGDPANVAICNYAQISLDRDELVDDDDNFDPTPLDLARLCGTKVAVRLHGETADLLDGNGELDLALFTDAIDDFAGLIDPYVDDGTVILHLTIDEPHDCQDWNGVCPDAVDVDQAAAISRVLWPTLPTVVNTLPGYADDYQWVHTDVISFVYAFHNGELADFIDAAVAIRDDGYIDQITWGMQVSNGGCSEYGSCAMTPAQVASVGSAMCASQAGSAVKFFKYSTTLLDAAMLDAIDDVRAACGDGWQTPAPFTLDGVVFQDLDNDPDYDVGIEPPLGGVTVELIASADNQTTTAVSAADGSYHFSGQRAGVYTLQIDDTTLPPGHWTSGSWIVVLGETVTRVVDIPVEPNFITGLVYRDLDASGSYDPLVDTVYPDLPLALSDSSGAIVRTLTTDGEGKYKFAGLSNGDYTVTVDPADLPDGWASVPWFRLRTMEPMSTYYAVDFAVQPPAEGVVGLVYADYDFSQTFEPESEMGLPGIALTLTSLADGSVRTATTGAGGNYSFSNLPPGTYTAAVDAALLAPGYNAPNPVNVTVTSFGTVSADFPLFLNGLSGLVFRSNDYNATYDPPGDVPYGSVLVGLLDSSGAIVATTVTAADGTYQFRGLAADTYTVGVAPGSLEAGWQPYYTTLSVTMTQTGYVADRDHPILPPITGTVYLSSSTNGNINGIAFDDEDILNFNVTTGAWALYIDLSDVNVTTDVDAFAFLADGSLLLSFDAEVEIDGIGLVDDSDIVRFLPSATGVNTAGTFQLAFDGSDVELTEDAEDIDAISFTPDGRVAVSTTGTATVSGGLLKAQDEDMLVFTPTRFGQNTSGSWALYFDGSDVQLSDSPEEDIWAAHIDRATGRIYISTKGAFAVTGVSGDGSDVFICDPTATGDTTACVYQSTLYFDGSANGFGEEVIDAFAIRNN